MRRNPVEAGYFPASFTEQWPLGKRCFTPGGLCCSCKYSTSIFPPALWPVWSHFILHQCIIKAHLTPSVFTALPTSSAMCSKCPWSFYWNHDFRSKYSKYHLLLKNHIYQLLSKSESFSEIHSHAHTGEIEGRNAVLKNVPISTCRNRIPNTLIWNRNCWNLHSKNTLFLQT